MTRAHSEDSREKPTRRYKVVGVVEGSTREERTVLSRFKFRSEAEEFAEPLRRGGKYLRVEIIDTKSKPGSQDKKTGSPKADGLRKGIVLAGCVVSVVVIAVIVALILPGKPKPAAAPPADQVAATETVAPKAEVAAAEQIPEAPARKTIPDFSTLDYSVDLSNVDYTRGPQGQELVERPGPDRSDHFPNVQTGFLRTKVNPKTNEAEKATESQPEGANEKPAEKPAGATDNGEEFVLHGAQTVFYPKGFGSLSRGQLAEPGKQPDEPRKHSEQLYYDGERHGTYTHWNSYEQVLMRIWFKHGKKHGLLEQWHVRGQKILEEPYIDGQLHGIVLAWYDNGKPRSEVAWVEGRREGLLKDWDMEGKEHVTDWIDGAVVFEPGKSNSQAFIWKMKTSADAIQNGKIIFKSADRFEKIMGKYEMYQDFNGGRREVYRCTDAGFRITRHWDNQGGCVIPMEFTYEYTQPANAVQPIR